MQFLVLCFFSVDKAVDYKTFSSIKNEVKVFILVVEVSHPNNDDTFKYVHKLLDLWQECENLWKDAWNKVWGWQYKDKIN